MEEDNWITSGSGIEAAVAESKEEVRKFDSDCFNLD
jgi:hypothetical protein